MKLAVLVVGHNDLCRFSISHKPLQRATLILCHCVTPPSLASRARQRSNGGRSFFCFLFNLFVKSKHLNSAVRKFSLYVELPMTHSLCVCRISDQLITQKRGGTVTKDSGCITFSHIFSQTQYQLPIF